MWVGGCVSGGGGVGTRNPNQEYCHGYGHLCIIVSS